MHNGQVAEERHLCEQRLVYQEQQRLGRLVKRQKSTVATDEDHRYKGESLARQDALFALQVHRALALARESERVTGMHTGDL